MKIAPSSIHINIPNQDIDVNDRISLKKSNENLPISLSTIAQKSNNMTISTKALASIIFGMGFITTGIICFTVPIFVIFMEFLIHMMSTNLALVLIASLLTIISIVLTALGFSHLDKEKPVVKNNES